MPAEKKAAPTRAQTVARQLWGLFITVFNGGAVAAVLTWYYKPTGILTGTCLYVLAVMLGRWVERLIKLCKPPAKTFQSL